MAVFVEVIAENVLRGFTDHVEVIDDEHFAAVAEIVAATGLAEGFDIILVIGEALVSEVVNVEDVGGECSGSVAVIFADNGLEEGGFAGRRGSVDEDGGGGNFRGEHVAKLCGGLAVNDVVIVPDGFVFVYEEHFVQRFDLI